MATVRIIILDETSGTKTAVEVPDDVVISQLVPTIAIKLQLPTSHGGSPISYKLERLLTANRMADNQTLQEAKVENDELFSISPEVSAGCFPAGTQITLSDGTKVLIENLKVGDFVLSYSKDNDSLSKSQVVGIYHGIEPKFLSINECFEVTPSHLLQINGIWQRADTLRIGDHLQNEKGEQVEVYNIETIESERDVYNVDLGAENSFYAEGFLVSEYDEKFVKINSSFFANGYLVNTYASKLAIAKTLPTVSFDNHRIANLAIARVGVSPEGWLGKNDFEIKHSLRDWWHKLLRGYGNYSCYGIFLLLPSDKEAIKYFVEFGDELDLITASDCLIIAFSENEFHTPITHYDDQIWQSVIGQQISEGHSVKVAKHFGIEYEKFPCLVLFKDIRSPNHLIISLKNSSTDEIAAKLRKTFSIVHKAANLKLDPLEAIHRENNKEVFMQKGQSIISDIRSMVGKTFETGIEAWIKSSLSPK